MKIPADKIAAVALILGLLCAASGCHSSGSAVPASREQLAPQFEESTPGVLRNYTAFHILPVNVYSTEKDYLRRVSDPEVEKLAEEFRAELIDKLGERYTLLPQPSRSVAFIQVAMTDVSTNYAAFQLLPGLVVPNAMRGGASIEANFIDSVSNRTVAVFRDSRQGARQGFMSGLGKWDGAKRAFEEWAQLLAGNTRR